MKMTRALVFPGLMATPLVGTSRQQASLIYQR